MGYDDGAWQVRAHGWRAVAALHHLVAREAELALREAGLSVVEFTLLEVLSRQEGRHHLRMSQVARATALSESAASRLASRLQERGLLERYLCVDDRRGVYTELTAAGQRALEAGQPLYRGAVDASVAAAREVPELVPVVEALDPVLRQRA